MKDLKTFLKLRKNAKEQLTSLDVTSVENALNIVLPDDYRQFLLLNNGGVLYYNRFSRTLEDNDTMEMSLYEFDHVEQLPNRWHAIREYEEYQKENLIPVGQTSMSAFLAINLSQSNFGKVYVADGDFGITCQANTFTEFIDQIQFDIPPVNWRNEDPSFRYI